MAILVKNNSGQNWSVPRIYGGGTLAWGDSMTIADSITNVIAAFGGRNAAQKLEFRTVQDAPTKDVAQTKDFFVSAELTGTGAVQNIPHGLGVVPANVIVTPTDLSPATVGQYTVVEGTHTTTNIVVTVTSGKKFKIHAEP